MLAVFFSAKLTKHQVSWLPCEQSVNLEMFNNSKNVDFSVVRLICSPYESSALKMKIIVMIQLIST